ncbi:MAG TPA: sulfurtransferase TusA family protein [Candidatus Binataceae bacterium]|nr:sulfurtransferase TusA family protein [Candidatus Binataceae bacterium]
MSSNRKKPAEEPSNGPEGGLDDETAQRLDLRGIKCPLNWAYAKVKLETMRRGEVLALLIDDPRGARDIPRAAEAEGYSVIEVSETGPFWALRIEK